MDEQKIERQVVGGWLDMFGYEVPAEEGAAWSRLINTHLAQTAMREPRFVPLATVPLQDGARAAEVLREAHAAGFKGAMIGTQPKGKGGVLDDPALKLFWEAANELGRWCSSIRYSRAATIACMTTAWPMRSGASPIP